MMMRRPRRQHGAHSSRRTKVARNQVIISRPGIAVLCFVSTRIRLNGMIYTSIQQMRVVFSAVHSVGNIELQASDLGNMYSAN